MRFFKKVVFLLTLAVLVNSCLTNNDELFIEIVDLIEEDSFFKTKELYELRGNELSIQYQKFTEAILDNAFSRFEESETNIDFLLKNRKSLADSLWLRLFETHYDNAVKLYNYKEAKEATEVILTDYKDYLTEKEELDFENSLLLWSALENVKAQKIDIRDETKIKMQKDLAGLNTLSVAVENDTLPFIFDTGANLSTTSKSVAEQLGMDLISVDIKVGTITGEKVSSQLAVCKLLTIGNIDIHNVVFLVLPDEALSFPQINYKIFGIVGFPVIEAMREIKITQDGYFIIPRKETIFNKPSNMAMKALTPLIYINNMHFTFDTGADHTIFYNKFYLENKDEIEQTYQPDTISFGGAAGRKNFEGYKIDYTFHIGEKEVSINDISLIKEKINHDETVYGNIGQDLIRQFDTMTLNFNQMFIKFE